MKKIIGLGLLMLTGLTAFAAPAAACNIGTRVVVARHDTRYNNRSRAHSAVRVQYRDNDHARR